MCPEGKEVPGGRRNGSSLLRESGDSEQGPLRTKDLVFGDEVKKEVEGHEPQT